MGKIILYHGTSDKEIKPTYDLGNDKHDYGRGFYLTEDYELAKEWAVCRPNEKYNLRDAAARRKMRELVDSDANKVIKVFSTLFER